MANETPKVQGIDAHGNKAMVDAPVGPAHLKDKHPNGRFTGKKDAHGNEIWETPEKGRAAAAEEDDD